MTEHAHCCHQVTSKTITGLLIAFFINMALTFIELIAGFLAGSVALIADALHNASDAFSILIAVIAYKIGTRLATERFSFGFKRAETVGALVNLILLFISGFYLLYEGLWRILVPETINGWTIIIVSILALIIDVATAKLSHHHAHHNSNMKMLFLHNLADAMGSIGVIISGLFVVFLGWSFIDGIIAILIASYMIAQAVMSFPKIAAVLMNAAPKEVDTKSIETALLKIKGIKNVAHIHLWCIHENELAFDCHIEGTGPYIIDKAEKVLAEKFNIRHTTIQIDKVCKKCLLSD